MKKNQVKVEGIFAADSESACARPLYAARVSAGFPSLRVRTGRTATRPSPVSAAAARWTARWYFAGP